MTKRAVFPAVICVLFLLAVCALPVSAQQTISNAVWSDPVQADVSAPLSSYPAQTIGHYSPHAPMRPKQQQLNAATGAKGYGLQAAVGAGGPSVHLSVEGISIDPGAPSTINCANIIGGQLAPPDTNMAVGDTQIVQWVNICYSVYDKTTGNLIAGPPFELAQGDRLQHRVLEPLEKAVAGVGELGRRFGSGLAAQKPGHAVLAVRSAIGQGRLA